MNYNNSVSVESCSNHGDEIINRILTGSVGMARPHSDEEPSCSTSKEVGEVNIQRFRMLHSNVTKGDEVQRQGRTVVDSRTGQCKYKSKFGVKDNPDVTEHEAVNKGRRPGHMSDDGISSISSDSRWKCQLKNNRSFLQQHDTARNNRPKITSSPKSFQHGYVMGRTVPNSGTVSHSSSKSSTPMKQETSYISQKTRSSVRSDGPVCRICHDGDQTEVLISPCYCAGSMGLLHVSCLQQWLGSSNKTTCEICHFQFTIIRQAKPFREFFRDPGTARDKRNLICDIISFILITPLTALTTWLSIVGAYKYYSNSTWEKGGLIGLAISLWFLYLIWFLVAARHNWRLWKDWAMFHQDVTLVCSPNTSPVKQGKGVSSKTGSDSTFSSVHLQGIEIKVSGPMARHKGKGVTSQSSKLTSTIPNAVKQHNKHGTSVDSSSVQGTKYGNSSVEQLKTRMFDNGTRPATKTKYKANIDNAHKGHLCRYNNETNVRGPEVYSFEKQSSRGHFEMPKVHQTGYHSDPEKRTVKKIISPLWETPERNYVSSKPVYDKYHAPAAIFSRGNSPDDAKDKTASQKYTEDWLDLKTFVVSKKRDGSDETDDSYHTCADFKNADKDGTSFMDKDTP